MSLTDLNHGRVGQIERWELNNLKRLYLRWNLIKKIENLEAFTSLVELEFYDNQITKIEGLDTLVNLM
jgi:protein phosphatase 1 regulatory subunit 7